MFHQTFIDLVFSGIETTTKAFSILRAIVRGRDDTSGVALVEVYNLH